MTRHPRGALFHAPGGKHAQRDFHMADDAFRYVYGVSVKQNGFTKEEFYRITFWEIVHPDQRDEIMRRGVERIGGGSVPSRLQFKVTTKTGEIRRAQFIV